MPERQVSHARARYTARGVTQNAGEADDGPRKASETEIRWTLVRKCISLIGLTPRAARPSPKRLSSWHSSCRGVASSFNAELGTDLPVILRTTGRRLASHSGCGPPATRIPTAVRSEFASRKSTNKNTRGKQFACVSSLWAVRDCASAGAHGGHRHSCDRAKCCAGTGAGFVMDECVKVNAKSPSRPSNPCCLCSGRPIQYQKAVFKRNEDLCHPMTRGVQNGEQDGHCCYMTNLMLRKRAVKTVCFDRRGSVCQQIVSNKPLHIARVQIFLSQKKNELLTTKSCPRGLDPNVDHTLVPANVKRKLF